MYSSFYTCCVSPESPERSGFKVRQVLIIRESFAFKRDISIGRIMVAVLNSPNSVFNNVPEIEQQNSQFELLP